MIRNRRRKAGITGRDIAAAFKAGLTRRQVAGIYRVDVGHVDHVLRRSVRPGGRPA